MNELDKLYQEINKNIFSNEKNIKLAEEQLNEYIEKYNKLNLFLETNTIYYSFNNIIEFILYIEKYHDKKNKVIWTKYNISDIYFLLGYINIEKKDYKSAKKNLLKSLKYNPMNINSKYELTEIDKIEKNFDLYEENTKNIYEYIYTAKDLARYYRNLGYCYTEQEKFDTAIALYSASWQFEQHNLVLHELEYISTLKKEKVQIMPYDLAMKEFKENNIIYGLEKQNLLILEQQYNQTLDKDRNINIFLRHNLWELTKDKKYFPLLRYDELTVGFSFYIPDSWFIIPKDDYIKYNISENTLFLAEFNRTRVGIVYDSKCTEEDFDKIYDLNIANLKKISNILYEDVIIINDFTIKRAITEIGNIRQMHNFLIINDIFLDISITTNIKDISKVKEDFNINEISSLIKTIKNTKAKLEDIFDLNKIKESKNDVERKEKTIKILEEQNIEYYKDMVNIPREFDTELVDKETAFNKMISSYIIASFATTVLEGKDPKIVYNNILNTLNSKYDLTNIFTDKEEEMFKDICNNNYSKKLLNNLSWQFEQTAVLAWSLSLIDRPSSKKEIEIKSLDEIILSDNLFKKSILKQKDEILDYSELIYRYDWACISSKINKKDIDLNEVIVLEQKKILSWILNFDEKKLMK